MVNQSKLIKLIIYVWKMHSYCEIYTNLYLYKVCKINYSKYYTIENRVE